MFTFEHSRAVKHFNFALMLTALYLCYVFTQYHTFFTLKCNSNNCDSSISVPHGEHWICYFVNSTSIVQLIGTLSVSTGFVPRDLYRTLF